MTNQSPQGVRQPQVLRTPVAQIPDQKEPFCGTYLVKSKSVAQKKDGQPFIRLKLSDTTGEIEAVVWDDVSRVDESVSKGQVVFVQGRVSFYQQRPQVTVIKIRPASREEYEAGDLVRGPTRDVEELLAVIRQAAEEVSNPHYRRLLELVLGDEEFVRRFKRAPAAKAVHHSYYGGLIEHTAAVLELVRQIVDNYEGLDRDLLVTSCILHDIGKIEEYSQELVIDRTTEGRLLGHIVLGLLMVQEYVARLGDFPAKEKQELYHVLISHHGALEWGSPQIPMTLEAIALHYLDNLDAKLNQFSDLMQRRKDPEFEGWTTYDRLLERRLYFGGPAAKQEEEQQRG